MEANKDNQKKNKSVFYKRLQNRFTREYMNNSNSPCDQFINQPLFQNGKRCGVIFVSSDNIKNQKPTFGKFTNYVRFENNNWRQPQPIYSFVVVRGKTSNIWSFPKGRMQSETESEEECASREVYEETGFKLQTVKNLPRIVIGKNVYFIYHTSKEVINNFTIYDNYEVGEVAWKTLDELKDLTCNKDIRAILKFPRKRYSFHDPIFNITINDLKNSYKCTSHYNQFIPVF